jgi:tetratricopeptide (TPR) repeat protein
VWSLQLPQLAQLRQAQASAALNRAVTLSPDLAQAHLELGQMYQQIGSLDLALSHYRAYRGAARRAGADGGEGVSDAQLNKLAEDVERGRADLAPELSRARVVDRARAAQRRGLVGEALTILLESDISAFGPEGMALELDLLLRAGRAADVRAWTTPDLKDPLQAVEYHWLRTKALAAGGEYAAAAAELIESAGGSEPDVARTSRVFAVLVGQLLRTEQPGGVGLSAAVSRVLGRFDFRSEVQKVVRELAPRSDAAVLRGLLALEAGEMAQAREAFRASLACAPDSPAVGGWTVSSWPVARDGLRLLK